MASLILFFIAAILFVFCMVINVRDINKGSRQQKGAIRRNPSESVAYAIDLGHYKPLVDELVRNIDELTKAGFAESDEPISSRDYAIREIIRKRKEEIRQQALEGRNDLVQAQLLGIEVKPKEVTPPNSRPLFTDDIYVDGRIIPAYAQKSLERRRISENARREKERLRNKTEYKNRDTERPCSCGVDNCDGF